MFQLQIVPLDSGKSLEPQARSCEWALTLCLTKDMGLVSFVPLWGTPTGCGWLLTHRLHKPMNNEKTPDSNFPLVRTVVQGVGDLGWKSMEAQGFLCWGPCPEEAAALQ